MQDIDGYLPVGSQLCMRATTTSWLLPAECFPFLFFVGSDDGGGASRSDTGDEERLPSPSTLIAMWKSRTAASTAVALAPQSLSMTQPRAWVSQQLSASGLQATAQSLGTRAMSQRPNGLQAAAPPEFAPPTPCKEPMPFS